MKRLADLLARVFVCSIVGHKWQHRLVRSNWTQPLEDGYTLTWCWRCLNEKR